MSVIANQKPTFAAEEWPEDARCAVCSGALVEGDEIGLRSAADGYQEPVCHHCEARRSPVEPKATGAELPDQTIRLLSQPLTYAAHFIPDKRGPYGFRARGVHGQRSYIRDLVLAGRRGQGSSEAQSRLDQHALEMKALAQSYEISLAPGVTYEAQEQRTVSWTSGQGGYSAPPAWIIQKFATVPTPERVLSPWMPTFDLPEGVQSINVPAWTAGAEMGTTALNATPPGGASLADRNVQSAVATIAGNFDVPLQMLEQSPVGAHFDWVAFTNMEARYGFQLEQQLYIGNGSTAAQGSGNNQLLGILNNSLIPASNIITYTDGTPSVKALLQTSSGTQGGPIPQAVAAIGNNRKVKPEMWTCTTSRAAWIASGEITLPVALSDQPEPGVYDLMAYPVYPSDAVPTNLGAGNNQDLIVCWRPSDWLLLESDPRTNVYTENISGTLMARLQLRRYVAAVLRQPTAVSYVTGTGLIVQSGF